MVNIKKKKIVFFMNSLSGYGGSKKMTISLVNKLSNIYDIKMICLFQSGEPSYYISPNVSVVTIYDKVLKIYELSTYRKMLKELKFKEIYELCMNLFYILFYYPQAKKKVGNIIKDVDSIVIPEIYGILYISRKYKLNKDIIMQLHTSYKFIKENIIIINVLKIYKKNITKLIVLTDADKKKFENDSFMNVVRIYNSIETKDYLEERNITEKIVFIGRLDIVKGVDYVLEIAKEVLSKRKACFEIYGDGPLKMNLKDSIERNGLSEYVKMKGNTDDVFSVLKNANCLIVPSRNEGLPMVFLESFSCGVPIVAFRCFEGIDEVIINGKNGFLVDVGDIENAARNVVLLLDNIDLNHNMGKHGFESIEKFKEKNIFEEWKKNL